MKKTAMALTVGSLLAVSTGARADAFARSYDDITNLVIGATGNVTIGATVDNSSASACLPNGTCVATGGAGFSDTPPAQLGVPGYVNNSYVSYGGIPGAYALADASIDSQQLEGDPFTRARALAEGQLISNSTANANAGNSSATLMSTTIDVGGGGATLDFRFDATPYIQSYLAANSITPAQAEGSIALNFNIIDSAGNVVFNWAPDGVAGGITGGHESADAFTLNTSLTAIAGNNGPLIYDPTGCAAGSTASGCFNASTNTLGAGAYTLNLSMHNNVNLETITAVPEPASYAMLLSGLGLLGWLARRRQPGA